MAGPVLGVDRVVGDVGVEPEAVALLAVVERAFEDVGLAGAPAPAASAAAAARGGAFAVLRVAVLGVSSRGGRLGLLGRARSGGLELRRDQGVVLGAKVDLVVEVEPRGAVLRRVVGRELVLALELLDLLDGDLELVGDPRVGSAWRTQPRI